MYHQDDINIPMLLLVDGHGDDTNPIGESGSLRMGKYTLGVGPENHGVP